MTSIFEGQPHKTRPFPIKTRIIWVPGTKGLFHRPYNKDPVIKQPVFNGVFWDRKTDLGFCHDLNLGEGGTGMSMVLNYFTPLKLGWIRPVNR